MSDDVFDQLVDDILSNPDENGLDDEDDDDASDSQASLMSSVEVNALDASDTKKSDEGEDDEAETPVAAAPKPRPKPAVADDDDGGDSSVSTGDSSVGRSSKKSDDKSSTLPLSTSPHFDHPDYAIDKTISMVSATRVFDLGSLGKSNGRSKEAEQLVETVENDLKSELRQAAARRGAHAVIGVSLSLTIADGLLLGHASGTPVRLRKRDE